MTLGVVVPAGIASAAKSPSTATSSSAVIAADDFSRVVPSGLGNAYPGGAWKFVGQSPIKVSVNGTAAKVEGVPAGAATSMSLPEATADDADVRFRVAVPTTPKTATGWYVAAESRRQADGRSYRGKLTFASTGAPRVAIYRVGTGGVETLLASATPTWSVNKGQLVYVEIRTTGAQPSQVSVRAWPATAAVPAWQATVTDSATEQIATTGNVGIWGYRSSTSTVSAWNVDSMQAWDLTPTSTITAPTTSAPTSSAPTTAPAPTTSSPAPTTSAPTTSAPTTSAAPTTSSPAPTPTPTPTQSSSTSSAPAPSPTPTESSTSPVSQQPDATNTGVPAGVSLTRVSGNLTLSTPGVYSGLDVHGFVYVTGPDITIRNSVIRGGVATGATGLVNVMSNLATNFVITDSEIFPEYPSVYLDGINGWNYTAIRVNIHGTVDGTKMFGNNATVRDSWIHGLVYYASDPAQNGGPTHNDAIQVFNGDNLNIVHNTLEGGGNAALQVTQGRGAVTNLTFSSNWAGGGACTLNLQDAPLTSMSGISVDHNVFSRTSTYNCPILAYDGVDFVNVGNTWTDGTGPVPVIRRA